MGANTIIIIVLAFSVLKESTAECPHGWTAHGSKCYLYGRQSYSWFDAQNACHYFGHAALAEPRTAEENSFVANFIHTNGASAAWIGAQDLMEKNVFVWTSDLTSVQSTHWGPGEPDGMFDNDCVSIAQSNGHWSLSDCGTYHQHYVCEMRNDGSPVG